MHTITTPKKEALPAAVATDGKAINNPLQLKAAEEEDDALQMKQHPLQKREDITFEPKGNPLQPQKSTQNPLQLKQPANNPLQLQANEAAASPPKQNDTGLPHNLKAGVEALSGYSMDDVKVHYNSDKPAQLQALAYAQGTAIHIAPGQEQHLPHEAWHVVQQKQGRVQPTLQMKQGIAVNDDKGLEHEADVMGTKALQLKHTSHPNLHNSHPSAHNNIVQRVIAIGGKGLTVEDTYDEMIKQAPKFELNRFALLYGILPAYEANGTGFTNIQEAIDTINLILPTYGALYYVSGYSSLADYLHNQKVSQAKVKENPDRYRSMLTTVGFEHEFADMKDSPLSGVSHIEVAESTEGMPFTGIKFLVETDASDALELVSPPFLFPTTKGSTVPKSDVVECADKLMKSSLYQILTERYSKLLPDNYLNRKYINQTLEQLLIKLSTTTGFTFRLKENIEIKPEYLSHKTKLNVLKDHVSPDEDDGNKLIVKPDSLKNISVGKSDKGEDESYSISSQVNFATDMAMAGRLQQTGADHGDAAIRSDTIVYKRINEGLRAHIPQPAAGSAGLASFYPLLIARLAGLFSVYSQEQVRTVQAALHQDLVAKATPGAGDRNLGLPTPAKRKEFSVHASMMSFVKDMTPAWIKDHVLSLAKGMLTPGDYPKLLASLKAANVSGFTLPANIDAYLQAEGHTTTAAHWAAFIKELDLAIAILKIQIQVLIIPRGSTVSMDSKPNVGLYEHSSAYIGARQDTYQDPEKIQMPGIHPGKRLHVTEIRRGNPADKLKELEGGI
jgi:hypothetical protein